jgi:sugar phosphate isomerase/epimerase
MRLHNAAGVLRRLDHYCGRLGMQLILENMLPHLFAGGTTNLPLMMEMLKDTHIGMCVDTGHAYLGGNLRQMIEFSKPCLRLVHASDNYGNRDDHLPPGDGIIDWRPVLRQLVEIGYSGTLIVEIADFEDRESTMKGACRGREYLRHLTRTIDLSAAKDAAGQRS